MANPHARPTREEGGSSREKDLAAVHVRFSPSEGRRLRRPEPKTCGDGRPLWDERPVLVKRNRGTYELVGTTANLKGLARWVLSFGASAEVRGPDRLRRHVAAEARRVLEKYEEE
jgi:predicted DNA-binding transcriptional regulator YafY